MKNISIFQLVVLCIFGLFIGVGTIILTIYSNKGGNQATKQISVTIWGTLDTNAVRSVTNQIQQGGGQKMRITYVQKSEKTFESDLAEAIATEVGPDIVLLRQDSLVSNLAKLSPISYDLYPARDYRDSFIEESELFVAPLGILAVPFAIDPLVMYWNRDLFSRAGLANPPRYWDEVFALAEGLTKQDASGAITQSAVALGNYDNITNAKEILSVMLLQSGNKIATWNDKFTSINVVLTQSSVPAESVLSFYTQFSDPRKPVFSWSRALLDSQSVFLSNRLGIYFGFASELKGIREKSPNLNFDITYVPQSRNGPVSGTMGRLYGMAVLKSSPDILGSVEVIKALTSAKAIASFVSASGLPPVRKDVKVSAGDPYQAIFSQSALVSHGWLDPNRTVSDAAFKDMIESVVSGFTTPADAMSQAAQQLRYNAPR